MRKRVLEIMTIESKQWAVMAIDFSRYKREGKRERKKGREEIKEIRTEKRMEDCEKGGRL